MKNFSVTQLILVLSCVLMMSYCMAQQAAPSQSEKLNLSGLPPVPINGKVTRKRLAELSAAERSEYETSFREFARDRGAESPNNLCNSIVGFCRNNRDEDYVSYLKDYKKRVLANPNPNGALSVQLVDLSKNSYFRKMNYLGRIIEGMTPSPPWSWTGRLFEDQGGNLIYLSEWDFVSENGGVLLLDESLSTKVGPFDSGSMLNITNKGSRLWHLTWYEFRKAMNLYYYCPTSQCVSQSELMKIANSIYGEK